MTKSEVLKVSAELGFFVKFGTRQGVNLEDS